MTEYLRLRIFLYKIIAGQNQEQRCNHQACMIQEDIISSSGLNLLGKSLLVGQIITEQCIAVLDLRECHDFRLFKEQRQMCLEANLQ